MTRFFRRMAGAAYFHVDTYEEVEADRTANFQALLVVVLAALAMGIGSVANSGPVGIFWHAVVAVVGWYLWAYLTYLIGTKLLPSEETVADHGELLRTLGFSASPGILRIAMLIPAIALPVFVVCTLWMLATMVVAVRQALDYTSTARAIAVCAIGFPLYAILLILSILVLGPWPV